MAKLRTLAGLVCAAAVAAVALFSFRKSPPRDRVVASEYVDAGACAPCHQELARSYRATGMGRSFHHSKNANVIEDFERNNTFHHAASGRFYELTRRDGYIYQRRYQKGFNGEEINVVEKRVDFVVGSGNHARSYLHRTAEGKLLELPVSWYSEKGGGWAMSPGYDRSKHQDFRRAILADCMFCHNGYGPPNSIANSTENNGVFPETLPEGIDCQRCHGPGRAHMEAAGSGLASIDAIRKAVVNPRKLDRKGQMEVCMQCHLETTSGPLPHMIRRHDRRPFSYRPGEPLDDYALYFDHAPGTGREDKFEIAHQAYRLRKSACFNASEMTCVTCHNPHSIPRGADAARHYVSVCRSCHQGAHGAAVPAKNTCIDCHMPRRRAEDAVHVVMTDHYIQRRPPSHDLLARRQESDEKNIYRGAVVPYYPAKLPPNSERELYLALAQVQAGANLQAGIPQLQQAIEKHAPEGAEFFFELGKAYAKVGNAVEAIPWYEKALARRADHRQTLVEFGSALIAAGHLSRAAEVLEKAVALPRPDTVAMINLGNVYLRQSEPGRAQHILQQAIAVDVDAPDAHNLLGLTALQNGDTALAEKHFREAIRNQPDLAEAQHNLGKLLASRKAYKEAAYYLEQATASNPEYAEAHHSYALVLLLTGSIDEAVRHLKQTVRLNPKLASAHNDLADLYAAKGRMEAAVAEYRLAIEADPNLFEAQLALGLIFQRKGQGQAARPHLEAAARSSDIEIRQAALAALGR